MEKRKTGAGSRWAKGRRRELEKGPSLSAWLRCYAQDEQTAEEAVRRAQNARESTQKGEKQSENVSDWSGCKNGVGWSEAC